VRPAREAGATARALWSAKDKIHFSLPALTVMFLQKFELKWTNI
jgi:hypothetical protein